MRPLNTNMPNAFVILVAFLAFGSCKKINQSSQLNQTIGAGALPNPDNSVFTQAPDISGGSNRPGKFDLTAKMPPVDPLGQGAQNSCVAWALAYATYSYYDHNANNTNYYNSLLINRSSVFSPAFLYNQINNGQDGGSSFIDALNKMSSAGICKWSSMPYNQNNFTDKPNSQQLSEALNYRITTDKYIIWPINDQGILRIKDNLLAGNPVIIRVIQDDNLKNYSPLDTIWRNLGSNQGVYHAMVVTGYDDAIGFKVQNSYGNDYKAKGFLWVTYANLKNVCTEGYIIKPLATSQNTKLLNVSGTLNFGNVAVGSTATLQFTINNIGNSTVTVSGINYPNGYSLSWTSGPIQPNSPRTITVTFIPSAAQDYPGTISINSDASNANSIQVSGYGTQTNQTRIVSLSGNLSFGNVPINQSTSKTLTITNNGNSTLNVFSISPPSSFTGSFNGPIQAGESKNISITFSPSNIQTYGGNIQVNCDATSGNKSIFADGTGIPRLLSLSPSLGTYSNCVSVGTYNCPPSFGLGTITSRVVSIDPVSRKVVMEIKKCNGTPFNAGGTWKITSLLCGGSNEIVYGTGSFSAGVSSFQMTFYDNNMIDSKVYLPYIIQGTSSNIFYSAPAITVIYDKP